MDNITLKNILNLVVKSQDIKESGEKHPAIHKISSPPKYVEPGIKVIKPNRNKQPIIIFSAPGAVGKTTLAKYFSHSRGSYYWDLSKMKLGDNTFIGTIAKHFGTQNLGNILAKLNLGQLNFFFDGFDEAEMVSGLDGIYSFVKEVYESTKNSPFPAAVFFSRTETVEWIKMVLDEVQERDSYSIYEIDYFDEVGAINFIKQNLDELDDNNYNVHPATFNRAIEKIFSTIAKGLNIDEENIWNSIVSKSFLGYSPVLQTISSYIAKENYYDIEQKFSDSSHFIGVELIQNFADALLRREQKKVIEVLKRQQKAPNDFNWESIYNPENQVKCLFSYIFMGRSLDSIINIIDAPSWLENALLDAVIQFLPNHPFIRKGEFANSSFRDYCLAILAENKEYQEKVLSFMQGSAQLSTLFAYYYKSLYNGNFSPPFAGFLYESIIAGVQIDGTTKYQLESSNLNDIVKLNIAFQNRADDKVRSIQFECKDFSDDFFFYRRIHNADINIESAIKLKNSNNTFELKDVNIMAKKLIIDARVLVLNCYEQGIVTLISDDFELINHQIEISKSGDGEVEAKLSNINAYPWSMYYNPNLCRVSPTQGEIFSKMYALRLILSPFRRHKKGVFGKQHEYIENVILKDNSLRREVFEKLTRKNILFKRPNEPIYELDGDKMQENGINWGELKSLKSNNKLITFLS